MATGGTPFDDSAEELHNWSVTNGSLVDRLNNMVRNGQKQKTLFDFLIMLEVLLNISVLYSHHLRFLIQTLKCLLVCKYILLCCHSHGVLML